MLALRRPGAVRCPNIESNRCVRAESIWEAVTPSLEPVVCSRQNLVFNTSVLGMVKLEVEVARLPDYQTDLKNPNLAKLADLSSGLKRAL
jgi:hypothetical protein